VEAIEKFNLSGKISNPLKINNFIAIVIKHDQLDDAAPGK
jgi:hypothetical protein